MADSKPTYLIELRSTNQLIFGVMDEADDTPEWLELWMMVGRFLHRKFRAKRQALEQLALTLQVVAQAKETARQAEGLARQRANYIKSLPQG